MEPAAQQMLAHEAEPSLLDHARSLWTVAPAWRLLAASTSVLVVSTVLTPLLLARANDAIALSAIPATSTPPSSCPIANWSSPGGEGVVIGFMSASQAASLLARTQASLSAAINPAYLHNPRAIIGVPDAHSGRKAIALVPASMTVKPGDRITYIGGFRDATLPCNYVPPLIVGLPPGR